jgi:hypothetical protein
VHQVLIYADCSPVLLGSSATAVALAMVGDHWGFNGNDCPAAPPDYPGVQCMGLSSSGGGVCIDTQSGSGSASASASAWDTAGSASATVSGVFDSTNSHTDDIDVHEEWLYGCHQNSSGSYASSGFGTGYAVSSKSVNFPGPCSTVAIAYGLSMNNTFSHFNNCIDPPFSVTFTDTVVFVARGSVSLTDSNNQTTPVNGFSGVVARKPDGSLVKLGSLDSDNITTTDLGGGVSTVGGDVDVEIPITIPEGGATLDMVLETDSFTFNGDINRDGKVDWDDRRALIAAIGSSMGSAAYNARADLNLDGSITLADYLLYVPMFNTLACEADFTATAGVTVDDIFAFLNAWFASGLEADFNGDGATTVDDIFEFLNAWFAGC